MSPEQLQAQIRAIAPQIVAWRRHLHMHPEPSFQEFETMEFVSSVLGKYGIPHQKEVAGTGVVAYIAATHHDPQTPCLGLRADLDALPIQERNEVSYKSQVAGWMHACGHDVHTSILLGAAVVMQANRESLKRPVKLIFQPGEEQNPGGASLMIKAGVLENPFVEELVALHVYPEMQVGQVGLKEGLYMASSDEIHVEIEGVGGHGALPERFVNPIDVGIAWMQAARQLVEDQCPKEVPQVLTFGRFEALGSTNVVTANAMIKGTFRTIAAYGATIEVKIGEGYPFLQNDLELTHKVKNILEKELGTSNVTKLGLRMTAEDFAFYSHHRPVCFFRLGTSKPDQKAAPAVHHPKFDIDENALEVGVKCLVAIALS